MTNNEIRQRLQRPALAALLDRAALALSDPLGLDSELPDVLTEVAMHLRSQKGDTVYVATWEHKYDTDVSVFSSMEQVTEYKNEIGAEWWDSEIGEDKPTPGPDKIGDAYFDMVEGEYFSVQECEVLA